MDGFINFFKEPGLTSNKALKKIKDLTGCKKAGFLGTLDPGAAGILPVALGKGTKLFPYFEKMPKLYRATVIFGSETDTQDATGTVTRHGSGTLPDEATFDDALKSFTGEITQVPPMYSAKKIDGQRLYRIARKGGEVERPGKQVTVHRLTKERFDGDTAVFTALVSQGTYIRTLCEDMGRMLGCLAHMGDLVREMVHTFTVEQSWTLEKLEAHPFEEWLLPMDFPIDFMPRHDASAQDERDFSNGGPVPWSGKYPAIFRLYNSSGSFFGIGKGDPVVHKILPEKIFFSPMGGPKKLYVSGRR